MSKSLLNKILLHPLKTSQPPSESQCTPQKVIIVLSIAKGKEVAFFLMKICATIKIFHNSVYCMSTHYTQTNRAQLAYLSVLLRLLGLLLQWWLLQLFWLLFCINMFMLQSFLLSICDFTLKLHNINFFHFNKSQNMTFEACTGCSLVKGIFTKKIELSIVIISS